MWDLAGEWMGKWRMEISLSRGGQARPYGRFLLTAKRGHVAAHRFVECAIGLHSVSEKITIDQSGANTAAVNSIIADSGFDPELRQSKYLNNLVEQDHRAVKRRT